MHTPLSTKRTMDFDSHIKILDGFIANQADCMAKLNRYIEQVRHPTTTFNMVTGSRDKVCQSLRALQAIRLVIESYRQDAEDAEQAADY